MGIGNNTPAYKLDVKDNKISDYVVQINNVNTGNSAKGLRIKLNATSPSTANYFVGFYRGDDTVIGKITGNVGVGVLYETASDRRLKTNIVSVKDALQIINKIQPRKYEYKANRGVKEYGFIAQELQPVYPQAVSGDPNSNVKTDPMMVDYSRLTPILTAGIKELNKKVEKQHKEIEHFKKENKTLIDKIEKQAEENKQLKQQILKINNLEDRLIKMEKLLENK